MIKCAVYSEEDFKCLRKAGELAAYILDYIYEYVQEGISTEELDRLCHEEIIKHRAIPAPLGYHGYPKSTCISLNEVICHGIPDKTKLKNGDILNIDVTVILDGWYGDTSRMYTVGEVTQKAKKLMDTTYSSLMMAIDMVKPGVRLGDIGFAIEKYITGHKFSVVRDYCGHGIGRSFHEDPQVTHFGKMGTGHKIEAGNVFTIEPMINEGRYATTLLSDGWTAVSSDGSLSAQFEHTIGVTSSGCEIFTLSPKKIDKPYDHRKQ